MVRSILFSEHFESGKDKLNNPQMKVCQSNRKSVDILFQPFRWKNKIQLHV